MLSTHHSEQRKPTPLAVNRHVAHKVRLRRQAWGLTQQELANLVGVTYQQLHKYERGINLISAGRLHAIAVALSTDVASFFEHSEPEPITARQQDHQHRLVELMHDVQRIARPEHRQAVCTFARAIAGRSNQQPVEPA